MTRADVARKRAQQREAMRPTDAQRDADCRRATDLLRRAEHSRMMARQLEAEAYTMMAEAIVILTLARRPVGDA